MSDTNGSGGRRVRKAKAPQVVEGVVTASVTRTRKKPGSEKPAGDKAAAAKAAAAKPAAAKPAPARVRKTPGSRAAKGVPDVVVPLRHRHDGWTPIRQRTFLRALSELGSVTDACKTVGMSKTSADRLRKRSTEFAQAWDKAVSIVAPILEQAAYERGVEGWDEPVFHAGVQIGVKRRYSDAALSMLMQARKRAEAAGMSLPDLATASIEELNAFADKAAKMAGGKFFQQGSGMSQAEVDAALKKRLETLAARRRKDVADRGEVWLPAGGYSGAMTVAEAAALRDDDPDQAQPSST